MTKIGNVLINSLLVLSLTSIILINISNETVQAVKIQDVVFSRDPVERLVEELSLSFLNGNKNSFYEDDIYLTQKWRITEDSYVSDLLIYTEWSNFPNHPISGGTLEQMKDYTLDRFFRDTLVNMYSVLDTDILACNISTAVESSGNSYPPEYDADTGLPDLDANGYVIYKTSSPKSTRSLTYNITCTYTDAKGDQQPLKFDFSYVLTSWDVLYEKVKHLEYKEDEIVDKETDFSPIVIEIYIIPN